MSKQNVHMIKLENFPQNINKYLRSWAKDNFLGTQIEFELSMVNEPFVCSSH